MVQPTHFYAFCFSTIISEKHIYRVKKESAVILNFKFEHAYLKKNYIECNSQTTNYIRALN